MRHLTLGLTVVFLVSCSSYSYFDEFKEALSKPIGKEVKYDPDNPTSYAAWYCNPARLEPEFEDDYSIEEEIEIRKEQQKLVHGGEECMRQFK